jgi:hypothetical protein
MITYIIGQLRYYLICINTKTIKRLQVIFKIRSLFALVWEGTTNTKQMIVSHLEQAFVNGGYVCKGESIGRPSASEECVKNNFA